MLTASETSYASMASCTKGQKLDGTCTCFRACWAWMIMGESGVLPAGAITTKSSSEPEE